MHEGIWNRFLTDRDKKNLEMTGFGKRVGFRKRPAFIIIDVNYNILGDKRMSILEALGPQRFSCGEDGWIAVPENRELIDIERAKVLSIISATSIRRPDEWDDGSWRWKNSLTGAGLVHTPRIDPTEIAEDIAPSPVDIVIRKKKSSALFGTNLASC